MRVTEEHRFADQHSQKSLRMQRDLAGQLTRGHPSIGRNSLPRRYISYVSPLLSSTKPPVTIKPGRLLQLDVMTCLIDLTMQAKEIERLNGVYKKLLHSNGVDMYGKSHAQSHICQYCRREICVLGRLYRSFPSMIMSILWPHTTLTCYSQCRGEGKLDRQTHS